MIFHIRYIEESENMYVDCIGIGELISNDEVRMQGILFIGENDNYLNNREMTKTLNSTDFFCINTTETIESDKLKYYKNKYPEFCL